MRLILRGAVSLLFLAFVFAAYAEAEPAVALHNVPWKAERLLFELSWFKLKVGTATMEASEEYIEGKQGYHISAITASNSFVDTFFKVRDRVDSFIYADSLSSYRYKVHQEEGNFRRDKEITFDYIKGMATYLKDQQTAVYSIPSSVQDALSVLYYLRTKKITVGKTEFINVFDDRKLWQVEVQVFGKEKIQTPAGVFDTIMVKPILKFEGIFQRKGDIYIWLTDDERKMPVRMRSKVKIGSISADLVEYKSTPPL